MPIKGWTEGNRLPRLGSIALGMKDENGIPKAFDYFVLPPEAQAVYGPTPRELDVVIPHEDLEVVMPAYLKRYGDQFGLICKGNGETAHLVANYGRLGEYDIEAVHDGYVQRSTGEKLEAETIKGKKYIKIPCAYKNCPAYRSNKCREVAILSVILFKVPGALGVYSLDTGSYNSFQNVKNSLEMLRAMLGRISFVPLKLKVAMEDKHPTIQKDGRQVQIKRAVPVLYVDMGDLTLENVIKMARERQLLTIATVQGTESPMIEAPDEETKPELLYNDNVEIPNANSQAFEETGVTDLPGNESENSQDTTAENIKKTITVRVAGNIPVKPVKVNIGDLDSPAWVFSVERNLKDRGIVEGKMFLKKDVVSERFIKSLSTGKVLKVEGTVTDISGGFMIIAEQIIEVKAA